MLVKLVLMSVWCLTKKKMHFYLFIYFFEAEFVYVAWDFLELAV